MRRKLLIALLGLGVIAGYGAKSIASASFTKRRCTVWPLLPTAWTLLPRWTARQCPSRPCDPAAAQTDPPPRSRHPPPFRERLLKTMASIRALLIDDDHRIAELLQAFLGQNRVSVVHQSDGQRGLQSLDADSFDVVLLDVMMPGIDGLEVCRRIRSRGSRIPIIMLTARGDEADRVVGLELGADDYLAKPFSPRELLARDSCAFCVGPSQPPKVIGWWSRGCRLIWPPVASAKTGARSTSLAWSSICCWRLASGPGGWCRGMHFCRWRVAMM